MLSAQVAALEAAYGVRLFDRTARGVLLTSVGVALLDIMRRWFSIETEAEEVLSAARELNHGIMRSFLDLAAGFADANARTR